MPGRLSLNVEGFTQHSGTWSVIIKLDQKAYKGWNKGRGKIYVKDKILREHWAGINGTTGPWVLDTDPLAREKNLSITLMLERINQLYYQVKELVRAEPTTRQLMDAYKCEDIEAYKLQMEAERKTIFTAIEDYIAIQTRDDDGEFINKAASTTAQNYLDMADAVRRMLESKGKTTIYLEDLDDTLLYQFELFMTNSRSRRGKPYAASTIVKYIEKLKAILTHIRKIGDIKVDVASNYKPNTILGNLGDDENPDMWPIPPQDLMRIESVVPPKKAYDESETVFHEKDQKQGDLGRVRLLFLFQSWTGMAFSDLSKYGRDIKAKIRVDLSGRKAIIYNRVKTGGLAIVPIFEQTEELLRALDYDVSPQMSYSSFMRKIMAMINFYAVKMRKEDEHSKTHLGRKLCGSRMLAMGMSMESVSRILGHYSIRETEKVYARIGTVKIYADVDRIQLLANEYFGNKIAM
jgi:integrase